MTTGLDALLSPYVGIARRLDEVLAHTADCGMASVACDIASDPRILGAAYGHVDGVSGVEPSRRDAVTAALGELAERYSLCYVPAERILEGPAAALDGAVEPASFALFHETQYRRPGFPFVRFDGDVSVPWVDGWEVPCGRACLVPAELVFLADPVPDGGTRIAYATSSGAACGTTREGAIAAGLLELLERDAFMILWAGRLSLPLLDWSGNDELLELEQRHFARTGLRYAAVDLSPFHGVPSVLGVVRAPDRDPPVLAVGAGTAATIERAWTNALSEAFACRAAARMLLARTEQATLAPAEVRSFDDHVLWWARHPSPAAAFLDGSPERRHVAEIDALPGGADTRIDVLVDRIAAAGSAVYAVDATAPDIADLGLHVVKTLAPGLASLDVAHGGRFLGARRLTHAPAALGLLAEPLTLEQLNPDPHPFP